LDKAVKRVEDDTAKQAGITNLKQRNEILLSSLSNAKDDLQKAQAALETTKLDLENAKSEKGKLLEAIGNIEKDGEKAYTIYSLLENGLAISVLARQVDEGAIRGEDTFRQEKLPH
jgi:DNA repair exonuclease SbcCD ATPase subunit